MFAIAMFAGVLALAAGVGSCGDDGLSRGTISRLEVTPDFVEFRDSPRPGFRTETNAITIQNGGDEAFSVTDFDVILDETGYISVKGSLPELPVELAPEDERSIVFRLDMPTPVEDDTPLTCPEAPATLPTEIDPERYCGQITIKSNAREASSAVVYLLVNQSAGVLKVEPDVLRFSNPQPGQLLTQPMTVRNDSTAGPLELKSFTKTDFTEGTAGLFSITGWATPITIQPGASLDFEVEYRPESTEAVRGVIEVKSDAGSIDVTVQADSSTLPSIEVTPDSLIFPDATAGSPESKNINISNSGIATLIITQMSFSPTAAAAVYEADFDGQVQIARGQSQDFAITYSPAGTDSVSGTLRIRSNAGNVPGGEVEVALSGSTASPVGSAAPTEIVFNVAPGESASRTLTVSNSGLADLQITGFHFQGLDDTEFSLNPDPTGHTVAPGELLPIEIVYSRNAQDVGRDVGNLVLETNNTFANGEVTVVVRNNNQQNAFSPVADINQDPASPVTVGTTVTLDGSQSTPESGDISYLAWLLVERPPASSAQLGVELGETTTLVPDVAGSYRVQLTVRNTLGLDGSVIQEITVTQ